MVYVGIYRDGAYYQRRVEQGESWEGRCNKKIYAAKSSKGDNEITAFSYHNGGTTQGS